MTIGRGHNEIISGPGPIVPDQNAVLNVAFRKTAFVVNAISAKCALHPVSAAFTG